MTRKLTAPAATAPWTSDTVQHRLRFLEQTHRETTSHQVAKAVADTQSAFRHRTDVEGLNLYAGSNVLSPNVSAAHDAELSTRPALGWPGEKVQPGVQELEELEVIASRQVALAMNANFAEVRYLTATMANLGVYAALTAPGDTIAILSPESGSHTSHQVYGTAGVRGLKTSYLPYNPDSLDIEHSGLAEFLSRVGPKLILVGGSVALFPHNVTALRVAADQVGATVVYDASHTAGLIAAGMFQNPLDEGAHVVTFSTYKTFGGPAGGVAVCNDPAIAERLSHAAFPVLSSNYDPSRLGPLAIAAVEAREQSPSWASETIALAQAVAAALDGFGLPMLGAHLGYTQTHQVVIDVSGLGGGVQAVRSLERVGIYAGACRLPRQAVADGPMGLRLGMQEVVRRGATVAHAQAIAVILREGLAHRPGLSSASVRELRRSFGPDIWGRPSPDQ